MAPSPVRVFLAELQRRKVIRVIVGYAIAAWIVVQVAATILPIIGAPEWVERVVLLLLALGLPLAATLSWAYDATPHGLVRATAAAAQAAAAPAAATRPVARERVAAPPRSVAVLPFTDMSAERDQEHFSDGIAEEILNMLARLRDIRVAARTSSFAFKGRSEDVRRIGEALGVASVVEGSVRKAGNRVRITVQLIDVSNGYHLWSERYDRQLDDVFAIQDEIARNIAGALDVKLAHAGGVLHPPPTADVRAYDLYLRARQLFHQTRHSAIRDARATFLAAVALDPRFALAYAWAAFSSCMLHMYFDHSPENLERADRDSLRALQLAPQLAEAHSARGLALSVARRYDDAEAEFDEALRLDDTDFDTHYFYARSCWAAGRLEQAARLFTRASELRPEDFQALALLESVYAALGRADDERRAGRDALERVERHLALNPHDVRALYLGAGNLVRAGQRERAREWAARAIALDPDDCATHYNVACVYGSLGDADPAMKHLDAAVQLGFAHRAWIENDGDFAPVRSDPRFAAILSRLS
jgi:adenylate cyclase